MQEYVLSVFLYITNNSDFKLNYLFMICQNILLDIWYY